MKPVSKSLFAATIALTVGALYSPAQAEIRMISEFPTQKVIDVRKIVADQPLNHRGYYVAFEASKIDAVVMFGSGSDKLSKAGEAEVAKAAALIKSTGKHVIVEGHTDSSGKAARNQDLSYRRALRVMTTLVRKYGVPASQLTAKGYGSSEPAATNSTAAGRVANRRVTFSIGEAGNT
jgi:outer membrane protein OmpA-like peptidoglycan-associated protein